MKENETIASGVTPGECSVDRSVRPIVVLVTRDEAIMARSLAAYHGKIADKIRAGGISLGMMLWLAGVSEMTNDEIQQGWLKELSKHNLSRVDVESLPDGGTRILLWPNAKVTDAKHSAH